LLILSRVVRTGFLFPTGDYLRSGTSFFTFHCVAFTILAIVLAIINKPWTGEKKPTQKQVGFRDVVVCVFLDTDLSRQIIRIVMNGVLIVVSSLLWSAGLMRAGPLGYALSNL
jgi:hypothetical protein